MRKTYSLSLLLLFIATFATQSCKKGGAVTPGADGPKIYLIQKIITKATNTDNYIEEFSYDNKNRITEYKRRLTGQSDVYIYKYTYDGQNRVIKAASFDGNGSAGNINLYTYNTDTSKGRPVYASTVDGSYATVWPISVNSNNQVLFVGDNNMCAYNSLGQLVYYGSVALYDPIYTRPYDNKNNPFANVVGINPHYSYQINYFPANTVNNMLLPIIGTGIQWTLTYNTADFPVSAEYTADSGFKHAISYEYLIK